MDIKFMELAVKLAIDNVLSKSGGPFGAIIVKHGKIIGKGCNHVTTTNDPTAHAEILAIRDACKKLGSFQLDGCEVYTSCEPCPMCIGALYWARPKAIYYASTKEEATEIGFDDQFIYKELEKPIEQRTLKMIKLTSENYDAPFKSWEISPDKVEY